MPKVKGQGQGQGQRCFLTLCLIFHIFWIFRDMAKMQMTVVIAAGCKTVRL